MEKEYGRLVCPGCGRELPEELHFCLYCMTRLDEDKAEAVVTGKRYKRKVIAAVLLCLALCLAGVTGYYFACPKTELPGAEITGWEWEKISVPAEVKGTAETWLEDMSSGIVPKVCAQLGEAAGEEVLVPVDGDSLPHNVPVQDRNPSQETVNPPQGETVVPLAGWFIADIPQFLLNIKEEFQRRGVTAEIVTTYEEYENSTLRKLGGERDYPACMDDFYLSYMPGRPCGEAYMEQEARRFVDNTKDGTWDCYGEKPEIIAVVFDRYEYIDLFGTGEYNQKEIWLRLYY